MGVYECDCLEHIHGWVWVGVTFQSTFMGGCIFIEDIYGECDYLKDMGGCDCLEHIYE